MNTTPTATSCGRRSPSCLTGLGDKGLVSTTDGGR